LDLRCYPSDVSKILPSAISLPGCSKMIKNKDLVSEISNELAIAILVEKRHRELLDKLSPKEFIKKIGEAIAEAKQTSRESEENLLTDEIH